MNIERLPVQEREAKFKLLREADKLIVKFKKVYGYVYEQCYPILKRIFTIKKGINRKYKYINLSKDVDISHSTVYRILSWDYASYRTKEIVKEGIMLRANVCRLLHIMGMKKGKNHSFQDEIIKHVIDNKLSIDNAEIYLKKRMGKYTIKEVQVGEQRRWYFIRDFERYYCYFKIMIARYSQDRVLSLKEEDKKGLKKKANELIDLLKEFVEK